MAVDAVLPQRFRELLADCRIFLVIRNGAAALREIDRPVVQELLARHAGLARALVVRAVPRADAQAFLADAEMLVVPVAAHRRRGDKANGLIVLALDEFGLAALPRRGAERLRPSVGVALAFDADEHRRRR